MNLGIMESVADARNCGVNMSAIDELAEAARTANERQARRKYQLVMRRESATGARVLIGILVVLLTVGIIVWLNAARSRITYAQYERIEAGMDYREVVQIVGRSGTENASSYTRGIPGVMAAIEIHSYSWSNSDGSNMIVQFIGGRVHLKAQAGLR